MREPGFVIAGDVVDIQSLVRYDNIRVDRREKDLTEYITLRQTKGWLDEQAYPHWAEVFGEIDSVSPLR